jgi:alkanesulfonate monooxygenase SsuD/methylene tetrahydromethanopterin reductase-like flavin-dependent oxidoreductase (luciferase family)
MAKQLHLGAFTHPVRIHTAWWRYPGAYADANFNLKHLVSFIQTLERGRFDAFFMADHLAVLNLKILPGALVTVGHTREEALEKQALLDSLVHPDSGLPNLSMRLGTDASSFELDAPLPEIPQTNASQSGRDALVALARRDNLTVRQLAQFVGGYGGLQMVGTAEDIADTMEEWLETEASDGFNIMFPTVPAGLDDFVDLVVPALQRRGILRREYEGMTLRHHLGLPRPENPFFT